jgi:hypothetical protein
MVIAPQSELVFRHLSVNSILQTYSLISGGHSTCKFILKYAGSRVFPSSEVGNCASDKNVSSNTK